LEENYINNLQLLRIMLGAEETLFKNADALTFEFMPKLIKHREAEQRQIIACIRPLTQERDGRNIFFFGKPGIGKTLAVKNVLNSIDDPEDDRYGDVSDLIIPVYINCWNKNTTFKIVEEICFQIGFKFTQNKKTEELMKIVADNINKRSAVFAFDEIDKVQDFDFLYTILEQIYRKCVILITNHKDFVLNLEDRIKSRLAPEMMEFRPYSRIETKDIMEQRKNAAFVPGCWEEPAFEQLAAKTHEAEDIRSGLHMMKEAGENAEADSSRKVTKAHVEKAINKADQMSVKSTDELDEECKFILKIVKDSSGEKIGNLYKKYQEEKGESSYKTFQRKIQKLADGKFINTKKVTGGIDGSTTIVNYLRTKKLTDF